MIDIDKCNSNLPYDCQETVCYRSFTRINGLNYFFIRCKYHLPGDELRFHPQTTKLTRDEVLAYMILNE